MKYMIVIIAIATNIALTNNVYAHTHKLHESMLETRQEQAERDLESITLANNNVKEHINQLNIIESQLTAQHDPEQKIRGMSQYLSELQLSMKAMRNLLEEYGRNADNLVITGNGHHLSVSTEFKLIEQLIVSTTKLQAMMLDQLRSLRMNSADTGE